MIEYALLVVLTTPSDVPPTESFDRQIVAITNKWSNDEYESHAQCALRSSGLPLCDPPGQFRGIDSAFRVRDSQESARTRQMVARQNKEIFRSFIRGLYS